VNIVNLIKKNKNMKNLKTKVQFILFNKEQLKYLKTNHTYHLVDSSP
jgi:hypothetical protein